MVHRIPPALCAIIGSSLVFQRTTAFVPLHQGSSRDPIFSQSSGVRSSPTFVSQLNVLAEENIDVSAALDPTSNPLDDVYRSYEVQLQELALSTSKDATIAAKAVDLVDEMRDKTTVDGHIYSILLNILAYSTHPDAFGQGEAIFQSMVDAEDTSRPQPDTETYCAALEMYTQHEGPERCQELVDSIPTVTTRVYNKLIQAYGKHGRLAQALAVYNAMEEHDTKTWIQILRAHRRATSNQRKKLWKRIPEHSLATFNAYLQAITNPEEADAVFYELLASGLEPDDKTLLHMLRSYKYGVPCFKIRQLLVHHRGQQQLSERTRSAALFALFKSSSPAIPFEVVQSLCTVHDNARLQRLALKCCAKLETEGPDDDVCKMQQNALEWALNVYNTNREGNLHGSFLLCVAQLLPASPKRDAVARTVFERARTNGEVDDYLLLQFQAAASDSLQLQVFGGFWDEIGSIPEEWSRNVQAKRA